MLWLWINAGHSTLSGDLPSFICLSDIFPTPLNCSPHHHHHHHHYYHHRNHYHLHHNHHLCHHHHHPKLGSHPIKEGAKSISFYFWRFSIPGFSFRNLQYEINLWGHLNFCLQEQNCSSENKDAITGTRNSGRAILNGYEASGCRLACGVYQQGTAARQEQICSKHNRYKALCRKTKEEKCSYCRDPLVVSCKPDDPVPTAGTCQDDRACDVPSDPVCRYVVPVPVR